jgi:hypothetical protein
MPNTYLSKAEILSLIITFDKIIGRHNEEHLYIKEVKAQRDWLIEALKEGEGK